ncbi:hypothetical protein, partial [Vibrio mediterranei]|uniref:hypothetical protein n=1 Tax=Vibrio mediterranei TaxID=689 RepID=UPI00148D7D9E
PSGQVVDLVHIRFYLNGNRHIKFNQQAMLRINCTASRLLGWVRSKTEFEQEIEATAPISNDVWQVGDGLKIGTNSVLALTDKTMG